MLLLKFILSMWFDLFSISILSLDNVRLFVFRCLINWFGVFISIFGFLWMCVVCILKFLLLVIVFVLIKVKCDSVCICLSVCWVSFRVGVSISVRVLMLWFVLFRSCCSMGSMKVVVFLVLVCVIMCRFWFVSVGGMVVVCIGVGLFSDSFFRVCNKCLCRFRLVNIGILFGEERFLGIVSVI